MNINVALVFLILILSICLFYSGVLNLRLLDQMDKAYRAGAKAGAESMSEAILQTAVELLPDVLARHTARTVNLISARLPYLEKSELYLELKKLEFESLAELNELDYRSNKS